MILKEDALIGDLGAIQMWYSAVPTADAVPALQTARGAVRAAGDSCMTWTHREQCFSTSMQSASACLVVVQVLVGHIMIEGRRPALLDSLLQVCSLLALMRCHCRPSIMAFLTAKRICDLSAARTRVHFVASALCSECTVVCPCCHCHPYSCLPRAHFSVSRAALCAELGAGQLVRMDGGPVCTGLPAQTAGQAQQSHCRQGL